MTELIKKCKEIDRGHKGYLHEVIATNKIGKSINLIVMENAKN